MKKADFFGRQTAEATLFTLINLLIIPQTVILVNSFFEKNRFLSIFRSFLIDLSRKRGSKDA